MNMTRSVRIWGEWTLTFVGVLLILSFFLVRAGQAGHRQAGIEAFETAYPEASGSAVPVAATGSEIASANVRTVRQESGQAQPDRLPGDMPDQTHWSEKRIQAYQDSLEAFAEVPLAILRMERLGVEVPVYNGTEHPRLDRGAGRIRGTGWIHGPGNLGIAAHRDGFFRPLKDVEIGDRLHLVTPRGVREYSVVSTEITTPDDVSVLAPADDQRITLVTCYPFYFVGNAPERFIVTAVAFEDSTTIDEGTS